MPQSVRALYWLPNQARASGFSTSGKWLHPGQPDALLFHLGYKAGKIGEILRVDGEVLVVVHVVDVHVHHVQGNVGLAVFGHHLFKVGLGLVAVAALAKAKGKFGRDVAAADDGPELLDHVAGAVAGDDVKGQVGPLTG